MPIHMDYEIGELVIVTDHKGNHEGRGNIVGRYTGRFAPLFDVQPEGVRDIRERIHAIPESQIRKVNTAVDRMVKAYNRQTEEPRHIRDEA